MSWVDFVKNQIDPFSFAKDTKLNLDAVINRSSLSPELAQGCALAAAVAIEKWFLVDKIAENLDPKIVEAAKATAVIMAQNNVWYPYVEMADDPNLKGLPAQLRMNVIASHGGVSKKEFEAFSLAASIIGKCHFCVKAHYEELKKEGLTVEQLRDIGRIAATMASVGKLF